MSPTFMRLWLQHQQSKAQGASGLATPPAPAGLPRLASPDFANLGSDISGAVGNAVTGAMARNPAAFGSPDRAGLAGPIADKTRAGMENLPAANLGPGPSPNAQGPAEGSLEWFDKATPTELKAHADKVRGMVKVGR